MANTTPTWRIEGADYGVEASGEIVLKDSNALAIHTPDGWVAVFAPTEWTFAVRTDLPDVKSFPLGADQ